MNEYQVQKALSFISHQSLLVDFIKHIFQEIFSHQPNTWSPGPNGGPGCGGGEHVAPGRGPGAGPSEGVPGAGWILLRLQASHTNVCQGKV